MITLLNKIDYAIVKIEETNEDASYWRWVGSILSPLRIIALLLLFLITQFEKPLWCTVMGNMQS